MPVTPIYGITYPDKSTKLRNLGDELKQFGLDVENALEQGAAPGPVDTGWVSITPESGYSEHSNGRTLSYRRIGLVVYLAGRVNKDSGTWSTNDVPLKIPLDVVPQSGNLYLSGYTNKGPAAMYLDKSDGNLTLARSSDADHLGLDGTTWMLDEEP